YSTASLPPLCVPTFPGRANEHTTPLPLAGKSALVTGAACSIGAEIALILARRGAKVVALAPWRHEANQTVHAIREMGAEAVAIGGDLTDPDVVRTLAGLRMADPLGPPTLAASRAVIFATFGRHFLRHLGQGVAELHRRSSHVVKRQRTMRVPIVRRETEDE